MLRAGLFGAGQMGRLHARVLQTLEGVEFVGAADPGPYSARPVPGCRMFGEPEQLLDEGIDICIVATPTSEHEKLALTLAEAGVHALIEKPLADDSEAGARIVEAFDARGLVGCVGHIERFNPAIRQMYERMAANEVGDIFQIATRRQGPFPERIRDVGVVMDLASHDLDLTAFVGHARYSSVAARTAHKSGRSHEDLVAVTGQLANGTVTNHLVNWLTPTKERTVMVTGEKGALVADTLTADLSFYKNGEVPTHWTDLSMFRGVSEGDMIRYAVQKREPLLNELEAFRDAVEGRPAQVVTLAEGVDVVRVGEAVLQSAREGRTVEI